MKLSESMREFEQSGVSDQEMPLKKQSSIRRTSKDLQIAAKIKIYWMERQQSNTYIHP